MSWVNSAEKRGFHACPETCPDVDDKFSRLEDSVAKYRSEEQDARNRLREALTHAYEEIETLEDKVDDLESRLKKSEEERDSLQSQLERQEA